MTPSRTYTEADRRAAPDGKASFEVADASGHVLLTHTENTYDMDPPSEVHAGRQPAQRIPAAAERGAADFVELATDEELNGKLIDAWKTYQQGLERFPADFELNKAAGRLAVGLLRYDEAARYLEAAAVKITNDPEIHYYLGLTYSALGQENKARAMWQRALQFRSFRPAARAELARRAAGNLPRHSTGRPGMAESPALVRPAMKMALLRVPESPKKPTAARTLGGLDPPATSFDMSVPAGPQTWALETSRADPYRVLDLAIDYLESVRTRTLDLLHASTRGRSFHYGTRRLLPQQHPLIVYYRGYCREKMGRAARRTSRPRPAFRIRLSNRATTIPVLRPH